ncbi:MAG: DUF1698 domain-containing protein [Anaerolineae bacterium]|nr:DUF1698 domain-containing protein [Anaerolineae bacterium]
MTPIFNELFINRHEQRKKYFFDPIVSWFGGSLKGKRVLDLGCNAGFWSLSAYQAGCDYVLGIDGREMHIDQANFVFNVYNIPTTHYQFVHANIFDIDFTKFGMFDIVLCLGLFYHINRPIELLKKISDINSDVLVIDTVISKMKGPFLKLIHEDIDEPRMSVDYTLVIHPTAEAVFDLVKLFGYHTIMIKPDFDSYIGASDFKDGNRRAFISTKTKDLTTFPGALETID